MGRRDRVFGNFLHQVHLRRFSRNIPQRDFHDPGEKAFRGKTKRFLSPGGDRGDKGHYREYGKRTFLANLPPFFFPSLEGLGIDSKGNSIFGQITLDPKETTNYYLATIPGNDPRDSLTIKDGFHSELYPVIPDLTRLFLCDDPWK